MSIKNTKQSVKYQKRVVYSILLQSEKYGQTLTPIISTHEMIMTTLHYIANRYDLNIWECLQSAYNVIKNRKGEMINGTFVKDEN